MLSFLKPLTIPFELWVLIIIVIPQVLRGWRNDGHTHTAWKQHKQNSSKSRSGSEQETVFAAAATIFIFMDHGRPLWNAWLDGCVCVCVSLPKYRTKRFMLLLLEKRKLRPFKKPFSLKWHNMLSSSVAECLNCIGAVIVVVKFDASAIYFSPLSPLSQCTDTY